MELYIAIPIASTGGGWHKGGGTRVGIHDRAVNQHREQAQGLSHASVINVEAHHDGISDDAPDVGYRVQGGQRIVRTRNGQQGVVSAFRVALISCIRLVVVNCHQGREACSGQAVGRSRSGVAARDNILTKGIQELE